MRPKLFFIASLLVFNLTYCDNDVSNNDYYNHKDYIVKEDQLTKLDNIKKNPEVIFFDYDGTIVDEGLNNEAARKAVKI